MKTIEELRNGIPGTGRIKWIGIRPGHREPMVEVEEAILLEGAGIHGDHAGRRVRPDSKRQVTLFQWEHLAVIGAFLGDQAVSPDALRRNIAVAGINLLALKDRRFQIGSALLEYTGLCHPCSRMEESLGPGGYQAVRGHGGINARVVQGGMIAPGGILEPVETE